MDQPTVTVLGMGYVGLTTATLCAIAGIKTYVVEPNQDRLASVKNGTSFFYEAGLDALIAEVIATKLLIPTDSYERAVPESDIIISAVGTPANPDGSSNLTYIFAAATEAAKYLKPSAIYVQKSTVPVGTGARVQALFKQHEKHTTYLSNPEFLREGSALRDSLWFDRIVVGGTDPEAMQRVLDIYRQIESKRDSIAQKSGLKIPDATPSGEYDMVSLESAELIKVVSNAFLALKISFANSIALLSDKAGADINEIMNIVGADNRIGKAFLNAGRGYGGGCFPKDISGLIATGLETGVNLEILRAAEALNESMPGYVIEKLQGHLNGSLDGQTIAVLGLAFKAGTSDTRLSPGIKMANLLAAAGATVHAYDPQAIEEAQQVLAKNVTLTNSAANALENAEAVIVATDWPEFIELDPTEYAKLLSGTLFVDAMNGFDIPAITAAGLTYIGVGR